MATFKNISLLIILSFGLLSGGCTTLPEPDFRPDEPSLKVVTYNVNWACRTPLRIISYIQKANAEVVFLQETNSSWEQILKNHLSDQYPYSYFHESPGAGGISYLSKRPLRNVKVIENFEGWFPAYAAQVQTRIGTVQLLNVHLQPPLTDNGSASLSAYYKSPSTHRKELATFLGEVDTKMPVIIAGDFNENEKRTALKALAKNDFTDALSLYDKHSTTWEWPAFMGFMIKNRYDHVFYSNSLHCTGAEVTHVKASDHSPVMAVITKPDNQK